MTPQERQAFVAKLTERYREVFLEVSGLKKDGELSKEHMKALWLVGKALMLTAEMGGIVPDTKERGN